MSRVQGWPSGASIDTVEYVTLLEGRPTRREFLGATAAGAGAGLLAAGLPSSVLNALASPAQCGRLRDIEHVVILIQENRSFDHYFGAYRGVRGFGDSSGLFAQPTGGALGRDVLLPFHLDTTQTGTHAECTNDISHSWDLQHRAWNGGQMDGFVTEHLADDPVNGGLTMGYYTRQDIDFYYAVADAFTICDGYHCSVIGPTDPNRLYTISAWLGQDGARGGPILSTSSSRVGNFNTLSWPTYPEQLQAAGIPWKVYGTSDGHFGDNVLPYFKNFWSNPQLAARGLDPTFPATFLADCAAGTLPQVSWILASLIQSEHPPAPPRGGESVLSQVLQALTADPALWAKTALFVTYDENGGFFDHVAPPVAPAGTAGEFVVGQPSNWPIGLGFRVPLLVLSPFSRGGFVCSDTFDHTSLLRFLETRFGPEVPNLTPWRRSVTGDLTAAFNFAKPGNKSVPALPIALPLDQVQIQECVPNGVISEADGGSDVAGLNPPYVIPPNSTPHQEPGTAPAPSGLDCAPPGRGAGGGSGGHGGGKQASGAAAGSSATPGVASGAMSHLVGQVRSEQALAGVALGGAGGAAAIAATAGLAWVIRRRRRLTSDEPPADAG